MQDTLGLASWKAPPTYAAPLQESWAVIGWHAAKPRPQHWLRGYIRRQIEQSLPRIWGEHLVWNRGGLVRISLASPYQKRTEHDIHPGYRPRHYSVFSRLSQSGQGLWTNGPGLSPVFSVL